MNYDFYGEVINGEKTYAVIKDNLLKGKNVLVGWTDGLSTHYDILFTYQAEKYGSVQRGLKSTDLFVSVIGFGTFGFKIDSLKHSSYIAEKLFNYRYDSSVEEITKLINGVINELRGIKNE